MKTANKITDPNIDAQIVLAYQKLLEKYPTSKPAPNAAMRLGQIFRERKELAKSAIYFELYRTRYFDSSKNDYRILQDLASYFEKIGATTLAAETYINFLENIYKTDPNSPQIPTIIKKIDGLQGAAK